MIKPPSEKEICRLRSLGLYYNFPEPAILCTHCGFALKADADRVSRHLGEKHGLTKKARQGVNQLIHSFSLPDPAKLPPRPDGSKRHPHLVLQRGAACRHCRLHSTSLEVLSRHLKKKHPQQIKSARAGRSGRWLRDHIHEQLVFQSWLAGDILNSWQVTIVAPERQNLILQPFEKASETLRCRVEELRAQELQHISGSAIIGRQYREMTSPALMTNWMRRTGWTKIFENAQRNCLVTLSTLPYLNSGQFELKTSDGEALAISEADEYKLYMIITALDRLFDRCGDTVRHTDVSIRRWLRGRFVDRPYKSPFELDITSESWVVWLTTREATLAL